MANRRTCRAFLRALALSPFAIAGADAALAAPQPGPAASPLRRIDCPGSWMTRERVRRREGVPTEVELDVEELPGLPALARKIALGAAGTRHIESRTFGPDEIVSAFNVLPARLGGEG